MERPASCFALATVALLAAGCGERLSTFRASGDPFATKVALLAAAELDPREVAIELESDDTCDDQTAARLCDGSLHFVATDDPSTLTISTECIDPVTPEPHLIGFDAIAIVVPVANTWASSLQISEVERILWSNGTGLRWSDLRREWPADEITVIGPSCSAASCRMLDMMIPRHRLPAAATSMVGVDAAVERIAASPAAVGWIPLASGEGLRGRVRAVSIDNQRGETVEASFDRVRAGAYPLATPLYLVTPPASARSRLLDHFVEHVVRHRGRLATLAGLVPLESGSLVAASSN